MQSNFPCDYCVNKNKCDYCDEYYRYFEGIKIKDTKKLESEIKDKEKTIEFLKGLIDRIRR